VEHEAGSDLTLSHAGALPSESVAVTVLECDPNRHVFADRVS
jgi:hypothetical protein